MLELSRRSFLRGLLTVAAASVVPLDALTADIPKIVGDGVHDDTAGLQAAISGDPFSADGLVIRGQEKIALGAGTFRTTAPLRFGASRVVVTCAPEFQTRILGDHNGDILQVAPDVHPDTEVRGLVVEGAPGRDTVGFRYL